MKEGLPVRYPNVMKSLVNHMEQMEKMEWVNKFFGKQLLIIFARIMFNIIVNMYFALYHFTIHDWMRSLVRSNYIIYELYTLMVLTRRCNGIMEQVKDTFLNKF